MQNVQTYDSVRKQWTTTLEDSGELRCLKPRERQMLESGSLDVLFAGRLKGLAAKRRRLHRIEGLSYLVLFTYLGLVAAQRLSLLPEAWSMPALGGDLNLVFTVIAVSLIFVGMCYMVDAEIQRREKVYCNLKAARTRLYTDQ